MAFFFEKKFAPLRSARGLALGLMGILAFNFAAPSVAQAEEQQNWDTIVATPYSPNGTDYSAIAPNGKSVWAMTVECGPGGKLQNMIYAGSREEGAYYIERQGDKLLVDVNEWRKGDFVITQIIQTSNVGLLDYLCKKGAPTVDMDELAEARRTVQKKFAAARARGHGLE